MNDNLLPVTLKWNKQTFSLAIELGETALAFKERVQTLTGVPVSRQKLLAKKGGWKGTLKDGVVLDASTLPLLDGGASNNQSQTTAARMLTITLIGSAETIVAPTTTTMFLEDLSPADLQAAEDAKAQAAMATAVGMIPALQLPPHQRDDGKQEWYQYNRLVTGLPQRQIEHDLASKDDRDGLQGKVALQLGLELRRAYINDLAVLDDGTCVSVLDDGHVQLWKHAAQQEDVIHPDTGGYEGGVDSVVALSTRHPRNSTVAFATAGRGSLQLWTAEADPILTLPGAMPGTSPASLQCVFGGSNLDSYSTTNTGDRVDSTTTCLAARFQIKRHTNPNQFRLPPQNEAERQRRVQAEAQEQAIQQSLAKASRSLQVWFSVDDTSVANGTATRGPSLQSQILEPPSAMGGIEGSAPVTCLATMVAPYREGQIENTSFRLLIAGDTAGGLRIWKVQRGESSLHFYHQSFYQLIPTNTNAGTCTIVCMETLSDGRLAVSTDVSQGGTVNTPPELLEGATPISVPEARAVHIFDFSGQFTIAETSFTAPLPTLQTSLTGHSSDAVICMCQLPDASLLTGGGKMDATLQLWSSDQIKATTRRENGIGGETHSIQPKASKELTHVGYVFALAVLSDTKQNSSYFALAAARYNTVKIIV